MNKGQWYRFLFSRVDEAINNDYFFEASFICYGIIEDRLASMLNQLNIPIDRKGVKQKINALKKTRSSKLEQVFGFSKWDGGKYKNTGMLSQVLAWGELYRNPMQQVLGDPRIYMAQIGSFHNAHTKDMAVEGKKVSRELSAAVMRYKKIK